MSNETFACSCPNCKTTLNIPVEYCGQNVECSECDQSFVVESSPAQANQIAETSLDQNNTDSNISSAGELLDLTDADTRIDPLATSEDEDLSEEELLDLTEGDTDVPFIPTSTGVIDLTQTDTIGRVERNGMNASTVKIDRRSVGMVPDYKKGIKFHPIESTQSINIGSDGRQSSRDSNKKWWQFWK